MKKVLSVILALILAVSSFAALAVEVYASKYEITSVTLSKTVCVYSGKVPKPGVVVKNSQNQIVAQKGNYTLKYPENANVGKRYVLVTFKGKYRNNKPVKKWFKVIPQRTKIKAIYPRPRGFAVEWAAVKKQVTGYQIQYSLDKRFSKKTRKTVTVTDKTRKVKAVSGLAKKKKYFVRLRTYKSVKGKRYYSYWSAVKSFTTGKGLYNPYKVNAKRKMVALTFDDGPGYNDASDRILDVLEKYNARATFFMVGNNAANMPVNVRRKVEIGCEIGNHTWNHEHYGSQVKASDIKKCSNALYKACGVRPKAFRAPGGMSTKLIAKECKKENMAIYFWSVDTLDWKSRNSKTVYNNVVNKAKNGDIILMHEIYISTADAVERLVPKLIKEGYQLVTCEELIRAKTGKSPTPGVMYYDGKLANKRGY